MVSLSRWLLLVAGMAAAVQAAAYPITFELSTIGWLNSVGWQTEPTFISFRFTFDSQAEDVNPPEGAGSYSTLYPTVSRLQIGGEVHEQTSPFGMFTDYAGYPQTYTVGGGLTPSASFLGRRFTSANFSFIDFGMDMLSSDDLPTTVDFASRASHFVTAFTFVPIEGDPEYGADYSIFRVCDVRYRDSCVMAPIRARQVPEPSTLALLGLGLAGLAATRRRKQ